MSVLLCGCASQGGQDDTYIGWYCAGEGRANDDWQCQKRRLRNGQPVDGVIYDSNAGEAARLVEQQEAGQDKPLQAGDQKAVAHVPSVVEGKSWQNQLPTMNAIEPLSSPKPVAETTSSSHRGDTLPPQPEPAFDTWADESLYSKKSKPVAELPAQMTRQQTLPAKGYTVQLGAFASEAALNQFIAKQNLGSLPVSRYRIISQGKPWHVLTFGSFSSRGAAVDAWAKQADSYSALTVWVRSFESLHKAQAE